MIATIVGIKRVDFTDKDRNRVMQMKYFLTVPGDNVEGQEVGAVSWDELKKGSPPKLALGELIDVEYNKYGRLIMSDSMGGKKGA